MSPMHTCISATTSEMWCLHTHTRINAWVLLPWRCEAYKHIYIHTWVLLPWRRNCNADVYIIILANNCIHPWWIHIRIFPQLVCVCMYMYASIHEHVSWSVSMKSHSDFPAIRVCMYMYAYKCMWEEIYLLFFNSHRIWSFSKCMYVFVDVSIHVYACICENDSIRPWGIGFRMISLSNGHPDFLLNECIHIHECIHVYTNVYMSMHSCLCRYVCVCVCVCVVTQGRLQLTLSAHALIMKSLTLNLYAGLPSLSLGAMPFSWRNNIFRKKQHIS